MFQRQVFFNLFLSLVLLFLPAAGLAQAPVEAEDDSETNKWGVCIETTRIEGVQVTINQFTPSEISFCVPLDEHTSVSDVVAMYPDAVFGSCHFELCLTGECVDKTDFYMCSVLLNAFQPSRFEIMLRGGQASWCDWKWSQLSQEEKTRLIPPNCYNYDGVLECWCTVEVKTIEDSDSLRNE